MVVTKAGGIRAASGGSRAGTWAVLAIWCLLSIIDGATRAHCLELGAGCAPSPAGVAASCHGQTPPGDPDPRCGSCVDVVVPDIASASCSRPDAEIGASAAALFAGAGARAFALAEHSHSRGAAPLRLRSPHPPVRATVLLI